MLRNREKCSIQCSYTLNFCQSIEGKPDNRKKLASRQKQIYMLTSHLSGGIKTLKSFFLIFCKIVACEFTT
jgi:hypothetical protein